MARISAAFLAVTLFDADAAGSETQHRSHHRINPVRKVINLLQLMQKKIEARGKTEEATYEEFMCYCTNSQAQLEKSIGTAEEQLPQLESSLKQTNAEKQQVTEAIKSQKSEKTVAEDAIGTGQKLRAKEKESFDQGSADAKTNINSINQALKALQKGTKALFLQSSAASVLKNVIAKSDLSSADADQLASFLSSSESSAASDEIIGILKQMGDEMSADLAKMTADEEAGIASTNSIVAAKEKEINALTKSIEVKTARAGEKSVDIANLKNDVEDSSEQLTMDQAFLRELEATCTRKKHQWKIYSTTQKEELLAISETIKLLNDDDALDLFKKTLPQPGASGFLQTSMTTQHARRHRAGAALRKSKQADHRYHLVLLALNGKDKGLDSVVAQINKLKQLLTKEQVDDDKKKQYCVSTIDKQEDAKKDMERAISDVEKAKSNTEGGIESTEAEIDGLRTGLKDLDQQVAKQTSIRKEEHTEFAEGRAENNAAIGLLDLAQNRLKKFYDPKLYKAPPKRELSEEDRISTNMGGTLAPTNAPGGISGTGITASFLQLKAKVQAKAMAESEADLGKPEAGEEKNGVIQMLSSMKMDLTKQNTQAEDQENASQGDYESFIKESASKRAEDSKALADKQGAKAELEAERGDAKAEIKSQKDMLMETNQEIANLHGECDWLLKNFDVRKEARASEMESLTKAVSVLKGAGGEGF